MNWKPHTLIPLTQGKVAIITASREAALLKFSWRAVKSQWNWYAKATLGPKRPGIEISMHRFVARTPFGLVCHHDNRNSLDNRDENLENMTKQQHNLLHANNGVLVKFAPPTS